MTTDAAKTMKAIGYTERLPITHENALIDLRQPMPAAGGQDLLVAVKALSVNPVDTKVRKNRAPVADQPVILGWDAVGDVIAIGDDVTHYTVGDRVWYAGDITRPGTNSEFHLVDERIVGRAPKLASLAQAAALPLTAITAYEMLFDRLNVTAPVAGGAQAVVIIGGAGGVGSIAIQLLRALTDLTVIATASRPQTRDWVQDLGAHHVLDHSAPLAPQVEDLGLGAPSFVFSTTHSESYIDDVVKFMAPQGRYGLIDDPATFNIMPFKGKSISIHWEMMYTRSIHQTQDMARQRGILNEIADLVDAKQIKSTFSQGLGPINAANLRNAHQLLEAGAVKGKLVLEGFDG